MQVIRCHKMLILSIVMGGLLFGPLRVGAAGEVGILSAPELFAPFLNALSSEPRLKSILVGPGWQEIQLPVDSLSSNVRQFAWTLGLNDHDVVALLHSNQDELFLKHEGRVVGRVH
jgi:hypothetical protein